MPDIYHEGHRRLQGSIDTRRLFERVDERIVRDRLTERTRSSSDGKRSDRRTTSCPPTTRPETELRGSGEGEVLVQG